MSSPPLKQASAAPPLDDAALTEILTAGATASAFAIEPSWQAGALTHLRTLAEAAARIGRITGIEDCEPAETFVP